jgi:putative zinc finger/helix-turn-helix YgiT family protein
MQVHEVKEVIVQEKTIFKNREVNYDAWYTFCDVTNELYMDEKQMSKNDSDMKNAYRKSVGLLTSDEIIAIRSKYGIAQTDLCKLLGWGGKTITRYEGHQVQDRAHDLILRKLDSDPEWFLYLLKEAKEMLPESSYNRCLLKAEEARGNADILIG